MLFLILTKLNFCNDSGTTKCLHLIFFLTCLLTDIRILDVMIETIKKILKTITFLQMYMSTPLSVGLRENEPCRQESQLMIEKGLSTF